MSDPIDFSNLQPDYFTSNTLWVDFMSALSDVIQEQIRSPIHEIEDIRHIVESTDPEIVALTIKELGFNLPQDLIRHNMDRLSKSVYILGLVHELSGTKDFIKAMRYVLGRDLIVTELYTENYIQFYDKPYGPLLENGGSWFQTTHIRLGIEVLPSDNDLILPDGKTLVDRLLEAYYEFAPINHVVYDFYYSTSTHASIGIAGKIYVDPVEFKTIGLGDQVPVDVTLRLPESVVSGESIAVYQDIRFDTSTCVPIDGPRYGYSTETLNTIEDILNLDKSLPDTKNSTLNLDIPDHHYCYIAYLKRLGFAEFSSETDIEWNGATWGTDTIGTTDGPLTLFDGVNDWYVYRTNLRYSGAVSFDIEFQYPGLTNTCDVRPILIPSIVEIPEPDPEPECTTVYEKLLPTYGTGPVGFNSDSDIDNLPYDFINTSSSGFSVDTSDGKYGYFSYPVSLGLATFIDLDTGMEGGWGGATWPEQIIGCHDNECHVADYPLFGSYGELETEEEAKTLNKADTIENLVINIDVSSKNYGWFCYPAALGLAKFLDTSVGMEGGWDGATWEYGSIGYTGDPKVIVINDTDYFVYRTDFPGLGVAEFEVTFDRILDLGDYLECDTSPYIGGGTDPGSLDCGTTNPDMFTNTDPIVITRDFGEHVTEWYLYRTEMHSIGTVDFSVVFENSGYDTSVGHTTCIDVIPPVEEDEPVDDSVCISSYPETLLGPVGYNEDSTLSTLTDTYVYSGTKDIKLTLQLDDANYAYFVYPVELGHAKFLDSVMGMEGGWDGAGWPADGSDMSLEGPIRITRLVNNSLKEFYLYRTDFPGLGSIEFDVVFENSGLCVRSDASQPTVYLDPPEQEYCVVVDYPLYGKGNNINSDDDLTSLISLNSTDDATITLDIDEDQYGYFAYPVALGLATFIDLTSGSTDSWDGATWDNYGNKGYTVGPALIIRDDGQVSSKWYLYRTYESGLGSKSYRIEFENSGLEIGTSVECDTSDVLSPKPDSVPTEANTCIVSGYPVYGSEESLDNVTLLSNKFTTTENSSFTISINENQYGYFAYPAALGLATFKLKGTEHVEEWIGADDYSKGPVIEVVHSTDWFVYRTEFPSFGVVNHYDVEFENSGIALGSFVYYDTSEYPNGGTTDMRDVFGSVPNCLLSAQPRYGQGNNINSASDLSELNRVGSTRGFKFNISTDDTKYGYFAYPAALGLATFIDLELGLSVGWDGATHEENIPVSIGKGPVKITVNTTGEDVDWLIYRTDQHSIKDRDYEVIFDHKLLNVGDRTMCNTIDIPPPVIPTNVVTTQTGPVFGSGPAGLKTSEDINTLNNEL